MKTPFALRKRATFALAAGLMGAASSGAFAAEDVDIFGGKGGTATEPNVLIVLDSSSNWSSTLGPNPCNIGNTANNTKFAAEVCALKTVLPLLPAKMRLGIMMFAESGTNGGYVRFAVRNMTAQNKRAMGDMVTNWAASGSGTDNSGSNQPMAKTLFEAWKYFGGGGDAASPQGPDGYGRTAFAGGFANATGTRRRDYNGNTSGSPTGATANRAAPRYGADNFNALASERENVYSSPLISACAKNFVIFIGNGNPGTGGDAGTPDAATIFRNIGGDPALRIRSAGTEVHPSLMDEFARHFYSGDVSALDGIQKIHTYTIAVYQPQRINPDGTEVISTTDQQMVKLMKSAANSGGGKYFAATSTGAIVKALLTILNEVQAVNSVFVSASLPVSVNTQGTFLNQVYMGLFRPDTLGSPRWLGNVKQYKFIQDSGTGDIYLADSTGQRAVNPATGFITPSANSFWTSASNFWANEPKGIPLSPSDSPDGDVVEKGGTAYVQRRALATSQDPRRLYTCPAGGCAPNAALSTALDKATITGPAYETIFGVSSAAELALMVDWIRGQDNAGGATLSPLVIGQAPCDPATAPCTWVSGERGPGWSTTVRASLQGDVLHSRPVVLNYSRALGHAIDGPVVFYGSNDGFLRAVKGGQDAADGIELWGFVAPDFYGKFRRQRYQEPTWLNPATPPEITDARTKDYFFDGPIGAWEDPTTSPPTKWIFVAARRGGRVLYAFDVTDPTQPRFKWRTTSFDLPQLAQTWSLPVAFKLTGVADPYLVFGAGYDPGEDLFPVANNNVGRGIFVLNADTGRPLTFITHASMTSPIASDIAFLAKLAPGGGFGDVYRGYVGDLDGNVWRLDIPNNDVGTWRLSRFAVLGMGKKFLFAPDLVKAGDKDIVLIGSGDREKPLVDTSTDTFYGLADCKNLPADVPALTPLTIANLTPLSGDSGSTPSCADVGFRGWYRNLAVGEKVVNSPLTVAGITYFSTNMPTPSPSTSCEANLGEARAYGLSFLTGSKPAARSSISVILTGGGLAPSPVGGVVEIEPGKLVTFVIGSGKDGSRLEPERPPLNVPTTRQKIYWNTKSDG